MKGRPCRRYRPLVSRHGPDRAASSRGCERIWGRMAGRLGAGHLGGRTGYGVVWRRLASFDTLHGHRERALLLVLVDVSVWGAAAAEAARESCLTMLVWPMPPKDIEAP